MSCKSLSRLSTWATPPGCLVPQPCDFPPAGAPTYLLSPGKDAAEFPPPVPHPEHRHTVPAPAQLRVPARSSMASFPLLIRILFLSFNFFFFFCIPFVLSPSLRGAENPSQLISHSPSQYPRLLTTGRGNRSATGGMEGRALALSCPCWWSYLLCSLKAHGKGPGGAACWSCDHLEPV